MSSDWQAEARAQGWSEARVALVEAERAARGADVDVDLSARGKVVFVTRVRIALDAEHAVTLTQRKPWRQPPAVESRVVAAAPVAPWCPAHGTRCAPAEGRCGLRGAVTRLRCRCLGARHLGGCVFAGQPITTAAATQPAHAAADVPAAPERKTPAPLAKRRGPNPDQLKLF